MPKLRASLWVAFFVGLSLIVVASTARRAATQSPALELIESDDARVQREGSWISQPSPAASGGSYLYSSGSAGEGLTLHFAGTRIEVGYVAHPALGTLALEIDNVVVRTVITTSETTVFGRQTAVDYLDSGPHVLRVYAVAGLIAIDAFVAPIVNYPGANSPLGVAQATASGCGANTLAHSVGELLAEVTSANGGNASGYPYCIYLVNGVYEIPIQIRLKSNIHIYGQYGGSGDTVLTGRSTSKIFGVEGSNVEAELHNLHLIKGNSLDYGGAVWVSNATLRIYDSFFETNTAEFGAGALVVDQGTVFITNTKFKNNSAGGGGAIQNAQGTLNISEGCFEGNTAHYGGAILNSQENSTTTVGFSIFTGNVGDTAGGGAIYNLSTIVPVIANDNYWGSGGFPENNQDGDPAYEMPDTISDGVIVNSVASSPPTDCAPDQPEPIPPDGGELDDYGVYIVGGAGQESEVASGVTETGEALDTLSTSWSDPVSAFRRIMLEDTTPTEVTEDDLLIAVIFESSRPVNCQTYNYRLTPAQMLGQGLLPQSVIDLINASGNGDRQHRAYIWCYSGAFFNQYTLVHELGHIFSNSSAQNGQESLKEYVYDTGRSPNPTYIRDSNDNPVMGYFSFPGFESSIWDRGTRGWGSGPVCQYDYELPNKYRCIDGTRIVTNFQQHGPPYEAGEDHFDETAADMFLNWVYTAFQDISWSPRADVALNTQDGACVNSNGCPDWRQPGEARSNWMNNTMSQILSSHGW
jgi:hypothetical protein